MIVDLAPDVRTIRADPTRPRDWEKIRPRNLAVSGPNLGVGVRHSLFPGGTRLGALAFAGVVLPDATLRGMRNFGLMTGPS